MLTEIQRGGSPKAAISPMHTRTHQRLRAQHISCTCLCHQMGAAGLCSFFVCVSKRVSYFLCECVSAPERRLRSIFGRCRAQHHLEKKM